VIVPTYMISSVWSDHLGTQHHSTRPSVRDRISDVVSTLLQAPVTSSCRTCKTTRTSRPRRFHGRYGVQYNVEVPVIRTIWCSGRGLGNLTRNEVSPCWDAHFWNLCLSYHDHENKSNHHIDIYNIVVKGWPNPPTISQLVRGRFKYPDSLWL